LYVVHPFSTVLKRMIGRGRDFELETHKKIPLYYATLHVVYMYIGLLAGSRSETNSRVVWRTVDLASEIQAEIETQAIILSSSSSSS